MRTLDFLASLGTGWRKVAVTVIGALIVGLLAASTFYPFHPMTVRGYEVIPKTVCPNEKVEVILDRRWQEPDILVGNYTTYIDSYWVEVDTGQEFDAIPGPPVAQEPDLSVLDGEIVSTVARNAAPVPGTFILRTSYDVRGRTLLLPSNEITFVTSKPIEVEPFAECGQVAYSGGGID